MLVSNTRVFCSYFQFLMGNFIGSIWIQFLVYHQLKGKMGCQCIVISLYLVSSAELFLFFLEELRAQQLASILCNYIERLFRVPTSVLYNKDFYFTVQSWQSLYGLLGTKVVLSSASHPQTNGWTKKYNRTIEQFVRCLAHGGLLTGCKLDL